MHGRLHTGTYTPGEPSLLHNCSPLEKEPCFQNTMLRNIGLPPLLCRVQLSICSQPPCSSFPQLFLSICSLVAGGSLRRSLVGCISVEHIVFHSLHARMRGSIAQRTKAEKCEKFGLIYLATGVHIEVSENAINRLDIRARKTHFFRAVGMCLHKKAHPAPCKNLFCLVCTSRSHFMKPFDNLGLVQMSLLPACICIMQRAMLKYA
mmetsp:Transcript_97761/g.143083  ORF Transcript_97761/g.143083 Transcript_97761/m.143083 type:complete len:206 (+) Transcript_97761:136-753(+)